MNDSKHEKLATEKAIRKDKENYGRDLIMVARVQHLMQTPGMTEELAIQYVGLSIAQQANDK